jgi:hypothetical protein
MALEIDGYYTMRKEVKALREENERLKEELADIQETYQKVMSEKCPGDEIHCTCVPVLREEIKQLKSQVRIDGNCVSIGPGAVAK